MWVPLQKNSPPDCFSSPSCILGGKGYDLGALPHTPRPFEKGRRKLLGGYAEYTTERCWALSLFWFAERCEEKE